MVDITFSGSYECYSIIRYVTSYVKYGVRSPKIIWAPCAQLYSLAETLQPSSSPRMWAQIRGRCWSSNIDDISLWPPALGTVSSAAWKLVYLISRQFCELTFLSCRSGFRNQWMNCENRKRTLFICIKSRRWIFNPFANCLFCGMD